MTYTITIPRQDLLVADAEIIHVGDDATIELVDDGNAFRVTVDLHEMLAEHHHVAVLWGTEDVLEIRPELTEEQAWEALQFARHHHDANLGLNWDALAFAAEHLYGANSDPDEDADEDSSA
jgi:hypothetical protein